MNSSDTEKLNNLIIVMEYAPKLLPEQLAMIAYTIKATVESRTAKIYQLQLVKAK